jgi:hypothetical protein
VPNPSGSEVGVNHKEVRVNLRVYRDGPRKEDPMSGRIRRNDLGIEGKVPLKAAAEASRVGGKYPVNLR